MHAAALRRATFNSRHKQSELGNYHLNYDHLTEVEISKFVIHTYLFPLVLLQNGK